MYSEYEYTRVCACRVLLTSARQGMSIVVPEGDLGVPPYDTRKPEYYDRLYNYLIDIGVKEILK